MIKCCTDRQGSNVSLIRWHGTIEKFEMATGYRESLESEFSSVEGRG